MTWTSHVRVLVLLKAITDHRNKKISNEEFLDLVNFIGSSIGLKEFSSVDEARESAEKIITDYLSMKHDPILLFIQES